MAKVSVMVHTSFVDANGERIGAGRRFVDEEKAQRWADAGKAWLESERVDTPADSEDVIASDSSAPSYQKRRANELNVSPDEWNRLSPPASATVPGDQGEAKNLAVSGQAAAVSTPLSTPALPKAKAAPNGDAKEGGK
jgi:hypothetical protein